MLSLVRLPVAAFVLMSAAGCSNAKPANEQGNQPTTNVAVEQIEGSTPNPADEESKRVLEGYDLGKVEAAAKSGDAEAMLVIGSAYQLGHGRPKDEIKAMALFRRCAALGDAECERAIGMSYRTGRGVPVDMAESLRWARLAAAHGSSEGIADVAASYMLGSGVPQDLDAAFDWYRRAAEAGNARGLTYVGGEYLFSKSIAHDYKRGHAYLRRAMALGHVRAMSYLGLAYLDGVGVERDEALARKLLVAAAKADDELALDLLAEIDRNAPAG